MRETVVLGRPGAERRTDLDWVRIGAFGLLIFHHVAVFYSPIPNMANTPRPQAWTQVRRLLSSPWGLLLRFTVSACELEHT